MKREILSAALAGLLTLVSQITQADEKDTLQQLLAENKNLTVQLDAAKKTEGQIAKAELANQGAHSALKHAKQELRQLRGGLIDEGKNIGQQAQQAGCPWGSTSTDKGFVAACNAEGKRLNEMLNDVKRRGASIEDYARKLEERQASLGKETMTLFAKKKNNNYDLGILYAVQSDWQRRYNAFVFQSDTYERLKKTAPGAKLCVPLSENAGAQALGSAAKCLERLWDGAR